jgi:GNAT superfamily N-acetyltransferase
MATLTIRPATTADRDAIVEMSMHFLDASTYGRVLVGSQPDCVRALVDQILALAEAGAALVLVAVNAKGRVIGMLGMLQSILPTNGEPYAEELCWWIEPCHRDGRLAGPRLLEAAEAWARAKGLRVVKMVAPKDVERFYEKRGYRAIETAFTKELV